MSPEVFDLLPAAAQAARSAQFGCFGDVGVTSKVALVQQVVGMRGNVPVQVMQAPCCGRVMPMKELSTHFAKWTRNCPCDKSRGFSVAFVEALNATASQKSVVRCKGCFKVCSGDGVDNHNCLVRGIVWTAGRGGGHMKFNMGKRGHRLPGGAYAARAAQARAGPGAGRADGSGQGVPLAPGPVTYSDIDKGPCAAAYVALALAASAMTLDELALLPAQRGPVPFELREHVKLGTKRMSELLVSDGAGVSDGSAWMWAAFAKLGLCTWMKVSSVRSRAVALVMRTWPFNYPASVLESARSWIASQQARAAARTGDAPAPTRLVEPGGAALPASPAEAGDTPVPAEQPTSPTQAHLEPQPPDPAGAAAQHSPPPTAPLSPFALTPQQGAGLGEGGEQHDSVPQLDPAEDRMMRAGSRAVAEGDIAAARRCAEGEPGPMGVTPTVFVDLQALHSASGDHTGAFTAAAVKGPHMALPIVTREMIAESLKKVNPRSAGGPTGWTFRLIKDLWLDGGDTFQNAVLKIVLTLCGGIRGGWRNADGSETLFSVIARTSRLIALPKKDGKPRPISIGDVFIRLAARCLVSATDTAALLLPGQFGVGSPGGVEPLIHLLRALLPNFLVLKLDVINAFNEVERGAIINEVRRACPELSPFVTWVYGTPSVLLVKTSDFTTQRIASQRGVRQGCPLSPFLFSLVWRTVLVKLAEVLQPRVVAGMGLAPPGGVAAAPSPDAEKSYLPMDLANACVSAYLDDTFAICRTEADCAFVKEQCAEFAAAVGLRLNFKPGKSETLCNAVLQESEQCVEVLGAFFGHDGAVKQALVDSVEGRRAVVDRLARWYRAGHAHGALAVLRVCTLPSRTHTSRCEVPSLSNNALELFAELVLGTLGKFVDTDLSAEQIMLATAPLWAGGLGFQALLHPKHSFPYAASVLLARVMLAARGINLDLSLVAEASPAITRGALNLPTAPDATIREWPLAELTKLSARMSGRYYKNRMAELFTWLVGAPCSQHDVWLHAILEHSTQLSGAWLTTIPREYFSLLTKPAIDAGIRSRLLMPILDCAAPSAVCACGSRVARDARFTRETDTGAINFCVDDGRATDDDAGANGEAEGVTLAARAAWTAAGEAAVAAMRSRMVADAAEAGIQPETAHAARCARSVLVRMRRHGAAVDGLVRSFRADGAWVKKEKSTSSADERRSDLYVAAYAGVDGKPRVHGHFDFKCVALAGVLPAGKAWPEFGFPAGIVSDADDKGFDAWFERAKALAFANITSAEKEKVRRHAPATVVPFVVSAGGGVTEATDKMFPAPTGRNGRHYQRQHLSGVLVTFRQQLAAEFASRNCSYAAAAATE
jgi:hypothetical protein